MVISVLDRTWRYGPWAAAFAVSALSVADGMLGWNVVGSIVRGHEREVFGALASVFGTLLGISFAVTAIVITFADRRALDRFAVTHDYADIAPMMARTNWSLAGATSLSLVALVSAETAISLGVNALVFGLAVLAATMLTIVIGRFNAMLAKVAENHHREAAQREDEYHNRRTAAVPGEFDDAPGESAAK